MILFNASASAQTITGKVVDENDEPLVGVTVTCGKKSQVGAVTDMEGAFSLKADRLTYPLKLAFKFIGYDPYEMVVYDEETTDVGTVKLHIDDHSLNEVVVVGYGETVRQKLVGSVAKVKGDVIATQTQDAPILGLQGNAAGVFIEQGSGVPGGANSNIVIRGYNALNTDRYSNMPLYIIDGVTLAHDEQNPVSYRKEGIFESTDPLSLINPNDIESIDILKDADATAIYGTRGANGVVLITTKKGKAGKVKVNFSADATAQWMSKRLDYASVDEYIALRKEAIDYDMTEGYVTKTGGRTKIKESTLTADNYPDLYLWDTTKDYDWQGALMGNTAWSKNLQLNISGGNKNTSWMISGGYYNSSTVISSDDEYTRWTGSANFQHHSDDRRFNLEAGFNFTNLIERPTATICSYANLNTAPNTPTYDDEGNPYYIPGNTSFSAPLSGRSYQGDTDGTSLMANATLSYDFWNELVGKVKVAYGSTGTNQICSYGDYYSNPYKNNYVAYTFFTGLTTKTFNIEPQITWDHEILGGRTQFLLGATYEYSNSKSVYMKINGFPDEMFNKNAEAGTNVQLHRNRGYEAKTASWFGRINYDYKDRYIANIVLRYDGSSRFGSGNRWGTFYSFGGGWLFTNEKFVKESNTSKWLSFGKLRMSYGKTGNDNVGIGEYLQTYSAGSKAYDEQLGLLFENTGDENLHWETVRKFDVGLELGFFKDRLLFSTNFYCNTSSDLLKAKTVAGQIGYTSITTNIDAKIRNTGWEFELNGRILEGKNWKWSSSLNMTLPKNKLIAYKDLEHSAYASKYVIGESINLRWGYIYRGINPENGIPLFQAADGTLTSTPTTADKVVLGDYDPDMYGGFNNTVKYKNFTLDVSIYFRVKPVQDGFWYSFSKPAGTRYNVLRDYALNHWTPENPNAVYPGITTSTSGLLYTAMNSYLSSSDYAISTGSYLRLNNIKLTYDLPKKLISRAKLDRVAFYVQGKNLFTITGYDSYSPETGTGYVPPSTSFSFGVNIGL